MKLFMGADHRGQALQAELKTKLIRKGYEVIESNVPKSNEDDYPDFAFDVCNHVLNEKCSLGILICGNGIGMSIAANKVRGIRCARVTNVDDAIQSKEHNGANVISFGGISIEQALEIIKAFIETPYPHEPRHLRRVTKIENYEDVDK